MRRTIVDPRFRAVLATLIVEAGISQSRLARQANVSPSHLSQILNGERNPSDQTAGALDAALGAGGKLTDLVVVGANPQDLDQLAAAATNPRRISQDTIASLAGVLAAQRHVDDILGSAAVIGPTVAQMDVITGMAAEAIGAGRPAVLYEAGQWAQFCAWLHISAGRYADARTWLSRALQWAIETGDPDLTATILSYQAHVAWLSLQHGPTIGLAQAALRSPEVYPGQRAYDAYQVARGHAALGDHDQARRWLDAGDEIAEQATIWAGPVPPWQYYREPWLWSMERGLVWLYAARWDPTRAQDAVTNLQAGVDALPEGMRGADWSAEYLVHLASAYRRAGDTRQARDLLAQAKTIAQATHSGRVLQLVAGRERALRLDEHGL